MKDIIKKDTKPRQWLWFIGLWIGGLAAAFLLGLFTKLFLKMGPGL